MNSDKKESIAVTAIINEVNQYDNLQENIKKREKEPVWDGDLILYQSESNKSSEIIGRIPVQVKGIGQAIDTAKNTLSYKVKISDIENYKKDKKGAIFFVVEVLENRGTIIYYKIFDIETIDDILGSVKKGQKTKTFQFEKLEKKALVSICIDFIAKLNTYETIVPVKKVEVYDKGILCYDYNTKYELDEMKKANKTFYETNAYKEAKEKLEQQNVIILHGEPWVGKTSTARKLVMNYIDQGYLFLYGNVDDLVEIKSKVAMEGKMICLLDDFLGSNVQYLEKNVAESTLDKIINIFKNSKNKKLIMTTRTYIYNNCKQLFYKFYHATGIKDEYLIDVANYNYLEKGNILYNHLQKNELLGTTQYEQIVDEYFFEDIIEHENFNPGVISLICERMKDKKDRNIKEYIREALKNPEGLWEEEYQKLTKYEKMILTIIVLFGVKVPEEYVREQFNQIMENEHKQLMVEDIFAKSLDRLTISFIKVTFDEDDERELEVCKHSIADYIISKIKKDQIDIEVYIKSANYAEILHYIDLIIYSQEGVKELLAKKVEEDFEKIDSFYYDRTSILYGILERKITSKREKILEKMIIEAFKCYDIDLIMSIIERKGILYNYTLKMFKKCIIDRNEEEYLYRIRYVMMYDEYLETCLEILNYQKNSEYAMINLEDVKESLIEVVSEDVESTIEEIAFESVVEDIQEGKTIEEIKKEHIEATVSDEMPSLRRMYSKEVYEDILETLYICCDIYVDEEKLQNELKYSEVKLQKTKKNYYVNGMDNKKIQKEHIRDKFNKGLNQRKKVKEEEIDYKVIARNIRFKALRKWWINSFVDDYIGYGDNHQECVSLARYYEFTKQTDKIDYSLGKLAQQFLEYIYQKYEISKKADEILKEIAYDNFIKGNLKIENSKIQEYELKFPSIMQNIYEAGLVIKKEEDYYFINEYIYLYIALEEIKNKQEDLLIIIINWIEEFDGKDIEKEKMIDKRQDIFHLYSEIDRANFNKRYVVPVVNLFVNSVQERAKSKEKLEIVKSIIDITSIEIQLNEKFDIECNWSRAYVFSWLIYFITGLEIEWDIGSFDYSIYQKQLYQKCYDPEEDVYILNFKEIWKDKELNKICSKLGVWNYLYDIYLSCIETVELIQKNSQADVYHIAKKKLEEKYNI